MFQKQLQIKKITTRLNNEEKFLFGKSGNLLSDRLFPHLVNLSYKIHYYAGNKSKKDENRTRIGSFNFVAAGEIPSNLFTFKINSTEENSSGEKIDAEANSIKIFFNILNH